MLPYSLISAETDAEQLLSHGLPHSPGFIFLLVPRVATFAPNALLDGT
jgi:hypothetical protein